MPSEDAVHDIQIEGFKSIRSLSLELKPVNIAIGASGSGKSKPAQLEEWLKEHSLGQLREKNEFGGRPELYPGRERFDGVRQRRAGRRYCQRPALRFAKSAGSLDTPLQANAAIAACPGDFRGRPCGYLLIVRSASLSTTAPLNISVRM